MNHSGHRLSFGDRLAAAERPREPSDQDFPPELLIQARNIRRNESPDNNWWWWLMKVETILGIVLVIVLTVTIYLVVLPEFEALWRGLTYGFGG
jgi:hypothetical protein